MLAVTEPEEVAGVTARLQGKNSWLGSLPDSFVLIANIANMQSPLIAANHHTTRGIFPRSSFDLVLNSAVTMMETKNADARKE